MKPVFTADIKWNGFEQITGEIFKGKPAILYGFLGVNIGCLFIEFADQNESEIYTLCDNRH